MICQSSNVDLLYSLDFLELARDRLKVGGLMTHWIPLPWSKAGVDDWETFGMLLSTFVHAFPYVVEIPSQNRIGVHVVGSMEPIDISREAIEARLRIPSVARDAGEWTPVTVAYFDLAIPVDRTALEGLSVITDDRPNLEFGWMRAWRSGQRRRMRKVLW